MIKEITIVLGIFLVFIYFVPQDSLDKYIDRPKDVYSQINSTISKNMSNAEKIDIIIAMCTESFESQTSCIEKATKMHIP